MSRLPIRWRLALAFALAMAVVLCALGAFLYVRLERSLTDGVDETLELRAAQIDASGTIGPAGDEGVTQLFRADGRLVSSSPSGEAPLLDADDVERARLRPFVESRDGRRLLATARDDEVLVVALSLEDRDDTLRSLLASCSWSARLRCCSPRSAGTSSPPRRCGRWRPCDARRKRSPQASPADG